jgi:DNA mismatch repair protein MutS
MNFEIDRQTIKDLEIFGDGKSANSVFNFYNQTKTIGGKNYLLELMENPLIDIHELNKRVELLRFIASIGFDLKIRSVQFDFIEHYIRLNIPTLRNNIIDAFFQNLFYRLNPSNDYYLIQSGIQQLKYLFIHLKEKLAILSQYDLPESLNEHAKALKEFIENDDFSDFNEKGNIISFLCLNRLDFMLRNKYKNELHNFIKSIYVLDAYISIGKVANTKKVVFPEYSESFKPYVSISNLYHPLLANAVPYNIEITESYNLCFLTGPNMAGKSTFLKSMGLAIYISHLGFPVPASKMKTSLYNGIVTTINLSDNINKGHSHFYSEVKRVKETALKLKEKNTLFVIFDELFRGTNVKDAFDASLLIIEAFAKINKSTFCISTHITEVAEKLEKVPNIKFKYFDSKLIDNKPVFEYKLQDGVSHERLGMYIVRNENIVEILNSINDNK